MHAEISHFKEGDDFSSSSAASRDKLSSSEGDGKRCC